MHTATMTIAGLLLLAVMLAIGHRRAGAAGRTRAARLFLPVWLAVAIGNLWVGVARAGYTVAQELPILGVIFGVPAVVAWLAIRRAGRV